MVRIQGWSEVIKARGERFRISALKTGLAFSKPDGALGKLLPKRYRLFQLRTDRPDIFQVPWGRCCGLAARFAALLPAYTHSHSHSHMLAGFADDRTQSHLWMPRLAALQASGRRC